MYHELKMCRTCLQMSRGDFKFISLDSVDPLWESNSPNLKAQLVSLVPEMKIDDTKTFICTSCFIALRTAYEFKRMCQDTEKKFHSHNYKYRRPFGVGPGSPQFHVTMNENRTMPQVPSGNVNNNNIFHNQKLNYLQADTSIDITEHHLYDASKNVPRRVETVAQKLPEMDLILKPQNSNIPKKCLNSEELKEKFNLGSQISIVKPEKTKRNGIKASDPDLDLLKFACHMIPYLKENSISPNALRCNIHITALTHDFVRKNTLNQYSLDDIKSISHSYYFGKLENPLECLHCIKTFTKRFFYQMHQFQEHPHEKVTIKDECNIEPIEEIKTETPGNTFRKLRPVTNKIVKFKIRKYIKCFICNKICVSRVHLLQHCKYVHVPRTVRKKKLFKSDYPRRTRYLRKLRTRTGHPYVSCIRCSICHKGFDNQGELDVHMYVHTPVILSMEDPTLGNVDDQERQFMCYLCGKSFLKERFLKLHNVQMHLRNKPTTCKNCGRVFKSEIWYDKHKCTLPSEGQISIDMPDENNMYPCSFCDRKFPQLRFMKVHRCRAHKDLLAGGASMDRESMESSFLDNSKETESMELYSIANSTEIPEKMEEGSESESDSNGFLDIEDLLDTVITEEDEMSVPDTSAVVSDEKSIVPKTEPKSFDETSATEVFQDVTVKRGRPSIVKDVKPLYEMPEPEIALGRRGNRTLPKIQCDFCGELLEENRYDKHIAEHNKSRQQRRVSTTVTHIEEYDSDDLPLKCPVCYRGFKRKYYYNIHINKHIEDGIDIPEVVPSPTNDILLTSSQATDANSDEDGNESNLSDVDDSLLEEDDIQGEEFILEDNSKMYVCCDKTFKLKAHFFRHYKIKHPNNIKKKNPIKYANVPETSNDEYPVKVEVKKVQNRPELTIIKNVSDVKNKALLSDIKKFEIEPVATIKTEPNTESDLEIGIIEDLITNKGKRKLSEIEIECVKKIKTESPEAVKLRNTVAAHLEDIEIVAVSPTSMLKYECMQCDKKFKQKSQFRDHQNVHTGEKPYKCEFCQPSHGFTQSSSLYFHIRKVHTSVMKNVSWANQAKNGLCLVCLEVFEKHVAMYTHLRDNYVENAFECEVCSKSVTMTCHYKNHNIDPNDMDSFMLPQQNLEVVLSEDAGSRPSSPTSNFDDFDESVNEADVIMNKARRCDPCGKIFKSMQYYNMHIRGIHHLQKVGLPAKRNTTVDDDIPAEQLEHMNNVSEIGDGDTQMETGEESDNSFNSASTRFPKVGTFKCTLCDQLFVTKTHLRKHRRTKHSTVPTIHSNNSENIQDTDSDCGKTSETIDDNVERFEDHTNNSSLDASVELNVTNKDSHDNQKNEESASLETTVHEQDKIYDVEPNDNVESLLKLDDEVDATDISKIEDLLRSCEGQGVTQSSKSSITSEDVDETAIVEGVPSECIGTDPIEQSPNPEMIVSISLEQPQKSELIANEPQLTSLENVCEKPLASCEMSSDSTEIIIKKDDKLEQMAVSECVEKSVELEKASELTITAARENTQNALQLHSKQVNYLPDLKASSSEIPINHLPVTQQQYSNQISTLGNTPNMHLSPTKHYRDEEFMPPPLQRYPRRPSQTFAEFPPNHRTLNYLAQPHATSNQTPPQNSNKYGTLYEQGFVIQEDEDVLEKGLGECEADVNPEQELLALLHNSNSSIYEMKKLENSFDSEQEFIDLESVGSKILNQSLQRLNKTEDAAVNADSSKPDSNDFLYSRNMTSDDSVNTPNESVDFQSGLPLSHTILNEMTHNFS